MVGWGEKEAEEREKAFERREQEIREREEKVMEFEQAIDKREQALDQRGYELEERSKQGEEEMETRSPQLDGLNASCLALGWNSCTWPITLLRSVVFHMLDGKTSSFLFCSCPPSSSSPNSSTPSSSNPRPDATGKSDAIYKSQQVNGESPRTCGHWHVFHCVEGACEEVDWGWDVELIGEED